MKEENGVIRGERQELTRKRRKTQKKGTGPFRKKVPDRIEARRARGGRGVLESPRRGHSGLEPACHEKKGRILADASSRRTSTGGGNSAAETFVMRQPVRDPFLSYL